MQHDGSQRTRRWTLLRAPLVFVGVLLLLGGCDSVSTTPDDGGNFDTEVETQTIKADAVNIEQIERGQYGNIVDGTQVVLRSEGDFASFWADLHADRITTPDVPSVDFEQQIVVAIVLGERSTGGYSVDIDQVMADEEQGEMRVEFTETVPGNTCAVTQALTSPYVVATVDLQGEPVDSGDEVAFARSEQASSC